MGGASPRQVLQQEMRRLPPLCTKRLHVAAAAQAARLGAAPLRHNALTGRWVLHRPGKHGIRSNRFNISNMQ